MPSSLYCRTCGRGGSEQAALQVGVKVNACDGLGGPPVAGGAGPTEFEQAKKVVDSEDAARMEIVLDVSRPDCMP